MKRIMAFLFACTMLLSVPFAVSAQTPVTITVGSVKGEIGDTVQVPVSVSEGHYMVNGRIFLTYDPTVLELQTVSDDEDNPYFDEINAAIIDSSFMWAIASPVAGRVNFVFATSANTGNATGGEIYTLTFKLLQETGGTPITATIPELRCNSGAADHDADLTIQNGTVKVTPIDPTPEMKGDTNGDGMVNFADSIRLFYYINGMSELTDQQILNADLNNDGEVALADAMRLFYYVSGQGEL